MIYIKYKEIHVNNMLTTLLMVTTIHVQKALYYIYLVCSDCRWPRTLRKMSIIWLIRYPNGMYWHWVYRRTTCVYCMLICSMESVVQLLFTFEQFEHHLLKICSFAQLRRTLYFHARNVFPKPSCLNPTQHKWVTMPDHLWEAM